VMMIFRTEGILPPRPRTYPNIETAAGEGRP